MSEELGELIGDFIEWFNKASYKIEDRKVLDELGDFVVKFRDGRCNVRTESEENKPSDMAVLTQQRDELIKYIKGIAESTYDFCMNPEKYPDDYINEGVGITMYQKRESLKNSDYPEMIRIIIANQDEE